MKVTATGVDEEIGMRMFVLWCAGLEVTQAGVDKIDVRFVLEEDNART